jgi:hypothetical protein
MCMSVCNVQAAYTVRVQLLEIYNEQVSSCGLFDRLHTEQHLNAMSS